ncbi:MAG: hypothetical protein ACRDYX_15305 [Egibacteraceae bacterium]
MTAEEKTLLAALTITAVLVPVVLGAALGWPVWSWLLLIVPLVGIHVRVARSIQRRAQREREAKVAQVEQPEVSQTLVADVALPSAVAHYKFLFSAAVYWRPAMGSTVEHANPGELAADAIVTRAQAVTATEDPSRVDVVRHRLAGVLGAVQPDASGGVEAWAEQVQLMLSEADQARLRKLSDRRKDQDIWERERDHERSKREYLADDVLKSPGSAVVWWLAQKDHDVEDTVRLLGELARLSAAANNAEVPASVLPRQFSFESLDGGQPFPNGSSVASQFGELMDALDYDGNQHALFAHHFARLLEKAGKPDEAQEIRRRFDAPAVAEESADIPEPDGELRDRPAPDEEPPPQKEPWWTSQPPEEPEQDEQP